MNDEEFKKRLSEVAEWVIPKTVTEKALKKKRGPKPQEEKYQEEHQEVFLDMFNGVNPTTPIAVIKIKIAAVDCEDCGRHCENGRKTETKRYNTHEPHWRKACVTCKMSQNPFTGEWDVPSSRSALVWHDWWRIYNIKKYKKSITVTSKSDIKEEI